MSSAVGLTRKEMLELRRRQYAERNANRPLRPPPKVNLNASPHRSPPPVKPHIPVTHNNINPVPAPPISSNENMPPPMPLKQTPAYLLAPFGVSGTVAPNARAEDKLRVESNGGPPDVHGNLRNARSESSQIGSHHELLKNALPPVVSPSPANALSGNAPREGQNADFDRKVRLLQERLRSGGDVDAVREVVDGSSVAKDDVPVNRFESDIQREMDRLQTEILHEFKSSGSPNRDAASSDQPIASQHNPASPPRFPSEKPRARNQPDYGEQLREQIARDEISKSSQAHSDLQADYEAKKQELERQRNAIKIQQEHQKRQAEDQVRSMEERKKQQEYAIALDRQMQEKRKAEQQEMIASKYTSNSNDGPQTSIVMPSSQISPADRRNQLRYQSAEQLRPQQTKRQELVEQFKDQNKLAEQLVNAEAEKRRRIKSAQEERFREEKEALKEKNRQQAEYLEQLKRQQQEKQSLDLQIEQNEPPQTSLQFGEPPARAAHPVSSDDINAMNAKQLYAQQLQEQIYQKQQSQNPPSPSNQTPAYLQSPTKAPQGYNPYQPPHHAPITNYSSHNRVPPHKTPPVSPRFFPSEQPDNPVEKFGQGLSTLYSNNVNAKQQQAVQNKAEYRRYLEQQIRDKKQRTQQSRISEISKERALLSPDSSSQPHQPHVSPAYEDHISSNFKPNVLPSTYVNSSSPRPVTQQPSAEINSAAVAKAEYAAQLREQMKANEEKKLRQKREQEEYDAKFDSPEKQMQTQHQLMSPDEYVDGPFGRRRLGGGGDPGGVSDLKKRSNLIRQISNDEVREPAPIYENASESPLPAGANAATRQKMVADVYGATGAGAALGFAPGRPSVGRVHNSTSQAPASLMPTFSNPNPPDARKLSAAEIQRNALQEQIEEKRRKKEKEEAKEREEDAKEWMRIQMENERLKAEEDEEKRKKQLQEQQNLEMLQAQREAEALKRMNRKSGVVQAAPTVASTAAPRSARARSSHRSPLPSAREPTPRTSHPEVPPTLRETQQQAVMEKVMSLRSPAPNVNAPGLKPGDYFSIDPNEMMRESSPFTKNMELLRNSVEQDNFQPLTEFQNKFKSDVDRFSKDVRPPPTWDSSSRPPVYSAQNDTGSEDQLEQSLRADSQFHAISRDGRNVMPFGQTMMGAEGATSGSASLFEGQPVDDNGGATEVDLSDAFVQQWQADNGFSSTTGGYAPHRKLLHNARDEGKLPNFRALNAMNSKRNFANGTKETMVGMASTAAPPVNANDALRRTIISQDEGGDVSDLATKSHFFSDDHANVAEVFGNTNSGIRSRNDPVEMSLKSESLLMYIKGPESSREKEAAKFGKELQTVGELAALEGVPEIDDSGPTTEQFGRSGFIVKEQRDVVRVEGERGGRYEENYEDDFADDGFEDENDLNEEEDEVLVISGGGSGSGDGKDRAAGEATSFSVNTITDEERELMMDQQRSKWRQPLEVEEQQEIPAAVHDDDSGLPRSNSEREILEKLKRMEDDLGVGAGAVEEVGEEVVGESSGEEEVFEEVEEEEGRGEVRRKSFTEKWLGIEKKDEEEAPKVRSKFNAELVFVNDEDDKGKGKGGKGEEKEVEGEDEEYSDDDDDEISPPSSPVKGARTAEEVDQQYEFDDEEENEEEDEISPPSSPSKAVLNVSDPGFGAGDLSPVDKKMVEDLVESYIKGGLKDIENDENGEAKDDDVALGEALLRVKSKVDASMEVE